MVSEIGAAPCLANASSCLLKPFQRLFYLRHHARSAAYGPGARRDSAPGAAVGNPRPPSRPAPWAFSEAAGLFVRAHPAGQQSLARWENKPGTGQAWPLLAPA